MVIKKGDKIKVEYTGTLDDGCVFDSSEGKDPIEFEAGNGMVIPGFDKAVIGMKKGEEKNVRLNPQEAYGEINEKLFKNIPRDQLPEGPEPKAGMKIGLSTKEGYQIPARISNVTDKEITIDLNHPLAGKTLNFRIKVIEVF